MTERKHLDSVEHAYGTDWYTLVIDSKDVYVERQRAARISIFAEQVMVIRFEEFRQHKVNGVSLSRLVARNLREIDFQSVRRNYSSRMRLQNNLVTTTQTTV